MERAHPFADRLKNRRDVEVIEVTLQNRDELPERIAEKIKARLEAG